MEVLPRKRKARVGRVSHSK